jgi:membrane-associated phospholipid phosphatase
MDYSYLTGTSSSKRSRTAEFLWHGAFLFFLLIIIGAEQLYRQPLLDWSVKAMRSIQANETDAGKYTFIWISNFGLGVPYVISLLYFMVYNSERGRSFYHLLVFCSILFVMSVTKMLYAEARMFWWVRDIYPDECTAEYGNPSGHTMMAIGYMMMLYLDYFENKRVQE